MGSETRFVDHPLTFYGESKNKNLRNTPLSPHVRTKLGLVLGIDINKIAEIAEFFRKYT